MVDYKFENGVDSIKKEIRLMVTLFIYYYYKMTNLMLSYQAYLSHNHFDMEEKTLFF